MPSCCLKISQVAFLKPELWYHLCASRTLFFHRMHNGSHSLRWMRPRWPCFLPHCFPYGGLKYWTNTSACRNYSEIHGGMCWGENWSCSNNERKIEMLPFGFTAAYLFTDSSFSLSKLTCSVAVDVHLCTKRTNISLQVVLGGCINYYLTLSYSIELKWFWRLCLFFSHSLLPSKYVNW